MGTAGWAGSRITQTTESGLARYPAPRTAWKKSTIDGACSASGEAKLFRLGFSTGIWQDVVWATDRPQMVTRQSTAALITVPMDLLEGMASAEALRRMAMSLGKRYKGWRNGNPDPAFGGNHARPDARPLLQVQSG